MKKLKLFFFTIILSIKTFSQEFDSTSKNFVLILPSDTEEEKIKKAANVIPSKRQYEWQKLEFIGFVHFGVNTFMDVEWGLKEADLSKFNPEKLDCNQWVKVFKDAGMKMIILTAKHHDGFCLWPSKYTDYNISNTPYKNGKGDIVKELSEACRKEGLKFGIYLSPWDIHEKTYGTPEYNQFFMNQLGELLTNYGEISEVWFDGACGEGPYGRKQIYDWDAYYKLIRELQPNAVIAIMGPDIRWVGTESGYGRFTEWSVLPASLMNQDLIAQNSQQQVLDGAFIPKDLTDEDLGSREKILKSSALIWYPAEADVSIRPQWFYHKEDDEFVKSPYQLFDIYFNSVGLNNVLLLNVPPDKNGLIHENDIKSLQGLKFLIDNTFKNNLINKAKVRTSNENKNHKAKYILDNNYDTYWTTEDTITSAWIEIILPKQKNFNCIMIQENILAGQRVEKFLIEYWDGDKWQYLTKGTTIGYKRLLRFPEVKSNRIKLTIEKSRTNPTISTFGLYLTPPEIIFQNNKKIFKDSLTVTITTDHKNASIYYTTDNRIPNKFSTRYKNYIKIDTTTTITAVAFTSNKQSLPVQYTFYKAKYEVNYNSYFNYKYDGGGKYALVDGLYGSKYFNDGKWQGFHGNDLDITIDLGNTKRINKISANFLQNYESYIFPPVEIIYSISTDGLRFNEIFKHKEESFNTTNKANIKKFDAILNNIECRYIRVFAKNIGICPNWHKGKGDKAWIFIDEVTIE